MSIIIVLQSALLMYLHRSFSDFTEKNASPGLSDVYGAFEGTKDPQIEISCASQIARMNLDYTVNAYDAIGEEIKINTIDDIKKVKEVVLMLDEEVIVGKKILSPYTLIVLLRYPEGIL